MRICFTLLLTLSTQFAAAQANYTKTAEIPPLRVSFTDLQSVLDKTEKLAANANANAKPRREEVAMKAGAIQVTIQGRLLAPPNAKVPDQIDSLTYTYSAPDQSPVTRVYFDFSDYRRTLTVEGPSPEQVDALFAVTREDLTNLSSGLGGSSIKILLGQPAYILLVLAMFLSGAIWYEKRSSKSLAVLLSAAAVMALLVTMPINDLLAGFMAIRGEPSFMVRYGPQMSFFGLLLAVVGVPISVLQLFGAKQKHIAASDSPDE